MEDDINQNKSVIAGINIIWFAIGLVALNLIALDYFLISNNSKLKSNKLTSLGPVSTSSAEQQPPIASSSAGCDLSCQELIDKKISELKKELETKPAKTVVQTTTIQTPGEKTVYFGGSGSTTSINWTDIADTSITINPADYPGAKGFKFVATLRSDAPDRKAFARIYNVTNNIEIWQSEISYAGLANKTLESLNFTLPAGKLSLKVQIKSFLLNTSYLDNPQLKIIY